MNEACETKFSNNLPRIKKYTVNNYWHLLSKINFNSNLYRYIAAQIRFPWQKQKKNKKREKQKQKTWSYVHIKIYIKSHHLYIKHRNSVQLLAATPFFASPKHQMLPFIKPQRLQTRANTQHNITNVSYFFLFVFVMRARQLSHAFMSRRFCTTKTWIKMQFTTAIIEWKSFMNYSIRIHTHYPAHIHVFYCLCSFTSRRMSTHTTLTSSVHHTIHKTFAALHHRSSPHNSYCTTP